MPDYLAPPPTTMTQHEAARYLRISATTLRRLRARGEGPPFRRVGGQVRYRLADVEAYLATSDAGSPRVA